MDLRAGGAFDAYWGQEEGDRGRQRREEEGGVRDQGRGEGEAAEFGEEGAHVAGVGEVLHEVGVRVHHALAVLIAEGAESVPR